MSDTMESTSDRRGLLGDTPTRAYGDKLELFNRFAEPEIRQLIRTLDPAPGSRVLDAGCGVGLTTGWFSEKVGESGLVVGCDLSGPHLQVARANVVAGERAVEFVQCDIAAAPFRAGSFDLVWCANTINHLAEPIAGVRRLTETLRPGGRIALIQSGFLPDMFFAWDERLERAVTGAVRQYYRDKYNLNARDTTAMRGLVGLAQRAGLAQVSSQTVVIERTAPLSDADRDYLLHAVFNGYWGERLRPYLSDDDWDEVQRLCDPASDAFCLDRLDFHHLQTLTMVVG
ncbi:MAG TPA: class I SAM-dependent methyltransferase [Thermomicrobiales bacterium]|nr:class I SAM-dependent methyltransferase [Thermomicrobiales bacterium]